MDGVPLIVVNDKEALENIDDTIEIVKEDVDDMNRSRRPSIFSKTR